MPFINISAEKSNGPSVVFLLTCMFTESTGRVVKTGEFPTFSIWLGYRLISFLTCRDMVSG